MKRKRILYIQYTTPCGYTILGHGARQLASRGWSVLFLGVRTAGSANNIQLKKIDGIAEKSLSYCPPGLRQKFHYLFYCLWVIYMAICWRASVIYSSEKASTPASLVLSAVFRFKVIYHEHDPAGEPRSLMDRLMLWCRSRLARRAACCVIPNEERLAKFKEQTNPAKAILAYNSVALSEVRESVNLSSVSEPLRIWYQGALGEGQLPVHILDALAQVPGVTLSFVGYETIGNAGFVERFLERARQLGIADRVAYLGTPASRGELYELSEGMDVGLATFRIPFRDPMAGASQKPFEYMAAGMALLVPDIDEWNRFIQHGRFGLSCDTNSSESIARALTQFDSDRQRLNLMRTAAQQQVLTSWNYESSFRPVVELMENLVLDPKADSTAAIVNR